MQIPDLSLVLLMGASGCGKSTFAANHFLPTEVVSSDRCRGIVSDDENSQEATEAAFALVHYIIRTRLAAGRLTVVDATNVQPESRKELLKLAREFHVLPVAIVFLMREEVCRERNRSRPDRQFGDHVIRNQTRALRQSMRGLEREGFRHVYVLHSPEEVEAVEVERVPLWTDRRKEHGPFDIVGDVHGCFEELNELLGKLGYSVTRLPEEDVAATRYFSVVPPEGRRLILLGDLVDRGPDSPSVLKLAMSMVADGSAICVPGNHDEKLVRKLRGRDVKVAHGLAETLAQLEAEPPEFREAVANFLDKLVSHAVLDDGRLVVAHAGMKQEMQGRSSGEVRSFALYGETTGEVDEFGLPERLDWAAEYRGKAKVIYGHTPVPEAEWLNGTMNIDTGCVFGGKLTALRYPEMERVDVPARAVYAGAPRPLLRGATDLSAQHRLDEAIDLSDVVGKRIVQTRLRGNLTLREENAVAALETMSRFAVSPKWLVYLPPTMSPTETSSRPGLLEHPAEGFAYFAANGVSSVICEEKHMGSRAVAVVCKDAEVARRRFGVLGEDSGVVYTRTGRRFFSDSPALEAELLARLRAAVDRAGLWEELNTDWAVLDCELMPWSAKAQELLRKQYAPVASAAEAAGSAALQVFEQAYARMGGDDLGPLRDAAGERLADARLYREAYRRYCWPVSSLDDYRLAPFHLLATEGSVHVDKDHLWHMRTLARLCGEDSLFLATPYKEIDPTDPASVELGVAWWEEMTSAGGEGMVIKPFDFVTRSGQGLVQPAVKCRGPEYLRIIYGPEYRRPENLDRLRRRGLGAKRSLAVREFALGIEALERFVRMEPLRRTHECVFAVLALESEPVDPRL